MTRLIRHIMTCLALASLAPFATAAAQVGVPFERLITDPDSALFTALNWQSLGPNHPGRSVAIAGSVARPNEWYMGTTGGGVFKSVDSGRTWNPVTDKYFGGTIGAIGIYEQNPDIVYVGGGEFPIRGNVSHGDGMWKTTDGGKTWSYIGLGATRQIARVRVHPTNANLVYVAALGHVWAPNSDRGIYRTKDGGATWEKILYRNDSTGAIELVMDPVNPNILYAALWQVGRKPWMLSSGGKGGGIFKSTDGGDTWTELTRNPGLPKGLLGNIGLAVSPAKPTRIWALIEADSGGVFRSDDAGATWSYLSDEPEIRQRPWYFGRVYADPADSDKVYSTNVGPFQSVDGGKTFKYSFGGGDNHDMWISRIDPKRMAVAHDHGVVITYDGGKTSFNAEIPTAQYYHVLLTPDVPYAVCGSQQDDGSGCIGGDGQWFGVAGCESGYLAAKPDNTNIFFGGCYGGSLSRMDRKLNAYASVNPWPFDQVGHHAGYSKYRFQWTFPIVFSPNDPNILYVGSNVLFKTTNLGKTWTAVSPDLTRNDPATLGPSGGPISLDQTSVEHYGTVFAFAESPLKAGVLWTGSDDGLLHVSRDAGGTWENITPSDMIPFTRISIIEASPFDPGTAYVAANRYQLDDNRPYLYKISDYGKTWKRIDAGIDSTEFTRVIRADPERNGLLYAGTERGVWVSFDDGGHWRRLQRGLPPVPVHDLGIRDGDLVAATHGRSFWKLPNLSTLRQYDPAVASKAVHFYKPLDTRGQYSQFTLQYWLKQAGQKVEVEFLDNKGRSIETYSTELDSAGVADSLKWVKAKQAREDSLRKAGVDPATAPPGPAFNPSLRKPRLPSKAGINTVQLSPSYPGSASFRGMMLWAGGAYPIQVPLGRYTVRLTSGGQTLTQTIRKVADPGTLATEAEDQERVEFAFKVRDRFSDANNAIRTIRYVRWQLRERRAKMPAGDTVAFNRLAQPLTDSLTAVEEEIYQTRVRSGQDALKYPAKLNNALAGLLGAVLGADGPPTSQAQEWFDTLSERLEIQLARLRRALAGDLKTVNDELVRRGLTPIVPSTEEEPEPKK